MNNLNIKNHGSNEMRKYANGIDDNLGVAEWIIYRDKLLEKFINTRYTRRGLISTYAIHKNDGNLLAYIQTTRRAINEEIGEFQERKDRTICTKHSLIETRKLWADLAKVFGVRRDKWEYKWEEFCRFRNRVNCDKT